MIKFPHNSRHLSSARIISIGFAFLILFGALLLMLPFSSRSGSFTSFSDAVFTATSAVCVTGLVVHDTATYWSEFGQLIILILIQIGGMGVITVATSFAMLTGRKIGLAQRSVLQEAISAPKVGGIIKLTGFILKMTFLIEFLGALFMAPVFCKDFGVKGLWYAVFHSISAFCNAGFDLMGIRSEYSSLTSYSHNPVINITIMLLIIVGGLGFLTWNDIKENRFRVTKYRMQSKVILVTTAVLLVIPSVFFFFHDFGDVSGAERAWVSVFQSVTSRTAGFNTADLTQMTGAGIALMIVLMIIGGSPGSTAGGMKTTTIAVLFASSLSVFLHKENAHFFGRRVSDATIKKATAIMLMYVFFFVFGAIVISCVENIPMMECLFETASAIGTVGLTLGITPELGFVSRCILIVLMFFGRVGGLTLIFAAISDKHQAVSKLPQESITVG